MRIKRNIIIGISILTSLVACKTPVKNNQDTRPNIIFMMADDHAAQAIGCYGSRINKTPNLDRLATEGIRFENTFCTNSICTPSRASILTGKHSHKNGVYTLVETLSPNQTTFTELLKENGYYTGVIGKWHLHTKPKGFDYWKVMVEQGRYHDPIYCEKGKGWTRDDEDGTGTVYKGFVTDITTNFGIDFLENRPNDKPFCLLLHFKAPHDQWDHNEKYNDLYANTKIPEPDNLLDDYSTRGNGIRNCTQKIGANHTFYEEETGHLSGKERKKEQYQVYMKKYLRCVASIDENVGRLLNYLDEKGLAENTIVVYTSDQGFFLGEHGLYDKRFMYEESLRMPFLVRYPKEIAPGSVNSDITTNIDFAPTFLEYANISVPDEMQGKSLKPLFNGETPEDWQQSMYYRYWMHGAHFNIPSHYGIRTKDYKLIFFYSRSLGYAYDKHYPNYKGSIEELLIQETEPYWELYDLKNDLHEMNNVYNNPDYSDIVAKLKNELRELKEHYGDTDSQYLEMKEVVENYWN